MKDLLENFIKEIFCVVLFLIGNFLLNSLGIYTSEHIIDHLYSDKQLNHKI